MLGVNFTEPPNAPFEIPHYRLVDMYMSCTEDYVKEEIIKAFTKDSNLRIVIATVAFGMGVDFHDVQRIIHFLPPILCSGNWASWTQWQFCYCNSTT